MSNAISYFNDNKLRLYSMVKNAFTLVPFYKQNNYFLPEYSDFDYEFFKSIPIIEKKDIIKNSYMLCSENYSRSDLMIDTTSGTTGQALTCYKTLSERMKLGMYLWGNRRLFVENISPQTPVVRFYAFRNLNNCMQTDCFEKNNELYLSLLDLCDEKLIEYLHRINLFKPVWLIGPPTAIYFLARAQKKYMILKEKISFIELNGEYVSEEKQEFINKYLCNKCANHYGSREFWGLAYSCKNGHLHTTPNCFFETVYNENNNQNELVISSILVQSWPLIRYRIGDSADIQYVTSTCNKLTPILNLHSGRIADYYQTPNKKLINGIFFSALSRSFNQMHNRSIIIQYQVKVSQATGSLKISIHTNENGYELQIINFYQKKLRELYGYNVNVNFQFNNEILVEKNGKTRDLIIED